MIDALLFAVRDAIRAAGFNYGQAECQIMDDGRPPPRAGNTFVAVHGGKSTPGSANQRNLYELFEFSVTLTMRVVGPLDTHSPASNLPRAPLGERHGFNAKVDQLRRLLHSNWRMTVLQGQTPASANDNLAAWSDGVVYGFCEPARYQGAEVPTLVGADWMGAEPESEDFAMKSELRFTGAKRFQPQTSSAGVFV